MCSLNLVNTGKHILLPGIAFDLISMLITKLRQVSFVYCVCLEGSEGGRKVLNAKFAHTHTQSTAFVMVKRHRLLGLAVGASLRGNWK